MNNAILKSQIKAERRIKPMDGKKLLSFCLNLSTQLLLDILQQAGLGTERDVSTLQRRTAAEGLGFLTKTLPSLGKSINSSLLGKRLQIPQFSKKRGTAIPHFMKGLLSRIFDDDGVVRDDADICAITDMNQFCFMFYKLEVPYDPKTEGKVLHKFTKTDASLPVDFSHLGTSASRLEPIVLEEARSLLTGLLRNFSPDTIIPRHGPGSVATGERTHEKMHFKRIYSSAEEYYPAAEYYYLNDRHLFDAWDDYMLLEHVDRPEAKVMLVPKDSRGPRLISAEPLEIQFLQQGLGRKLVQWIERHPLTRGRVNFKDQRINRRLALQGSIDGSWSTLDLTDASDRVSLALVKSLFADTPILGHLLALRSLTTVLPNGETVEMQKYAPMGSALCFPVEALCFWALAAACIHVYGGKSLRQACATTYVYGDDIIVRGGDEVFLLQNFHYFGLRLSEKKCCYTGHFRESCGCDAYKGEVITPVKVKKLPPRSRTDGQSFASWVAVSNLLQQKAYYRAAAYILNYVEQTFGLLPLSERDPHRVRPLEKVARSRQVSLGTNDQLIQCAAVEISDSCPCWYVRIKPGVDDQKLHQRIPKSRIKYNRDLQRYEYRTLGLTGVRLILPTPTWRTLSGWRSLSSFRELGASDWSELYRHFLADMGTVPGVYTLPRRIKLKRGWTCLAY